MLLPLAASSLVLALGSLALWLRGKPADGHPHCRRCRFDLIGTPDALTCPECGADLSRARSVKLNNRRRPRPLLALAALLLLTAGALTVPPVRSHLATVEWMPHKPTWWLIRETRSANPALVGPVLRELLRRFEIGALDGGTVLELAEQGFDYLNTGSPCGMWNSEYGNFIDIAIAQGLFAGERKQRYMLNSVGLWWSGPTYRRFVGAPTNPFFFVSVSDFVGHPSRSAAAPPPIDFELHELSADLDGEPAEIEVHFHQGEVNRSTSFATATIELPEEWQGRTLVIRWRVQVVGLRSREPIGDPWTGTRTITLDKRVKGGARRQDDQPPPDISRY